MNYLCIYHANCADGFTAAWVVRRAFNEKKLPLQEENSTIEFHPGVYGEPVPNCIGKFVIIVDFSYDYKSTVEIKHVAKELILLDHHKSAIDRLEGRFAANWPSAIVFDTTRSGAGIAWDHFFPLRDRPQIVELTEDRDLWKFQYEATRNFAANLFSYKYTFENWDAAHAMLSTSDGFEAFQVAGAAIERKHHKDIEELLAQTQHEIYWNDRDDPEVPYLVPIANLPYVYSSDAANKMSESKDIPFAACYYLTKDGYAVFSLRSHKEHGADVAKIAEVFGGGGHKNAAGFKVRTYELMCWLADGEVIHEDDFPF